MYICFSLKELSYATLVKLAVDLNFDLDVITLVGKVKDSGRWDYRIKKDKINTEERKIIERAGLEIYSPSKEYRKNVYKDYI